MTAGQVTTSNERTVPVDVYSCLPQILQDGCSCFQRTEEREAFLFAALPVLTQALPHTRIVLDDKDHALALMVYIYGGSGMGKGAASHALALISDLEERERQRNKQSEKDYLKAMAEDKDGAGDPPPLVDVLLPLRTTPSTLLARLERNPPGMAPMLADTEGHALGNPANKDHGSIRELLLKGAEGERDGQLWKKEGLISVQVWLSIMVTSTVQHMKDGIKSTEDGLFSRFLWHRVPDGDGIYRDPKPKGNTSRATKIHRLSPRVTSIYDKLQQAAGVTVQFTDEQYQDHVGIMQENMDQALDINKQLQGVMGRLGKRLLRMAATFAVLRKAEEVDRMPRTIVCDDLSWSATMQLTTPLYESMMDVYTMFNPDAVEQSKDTPHKAAYQLVRQYCVYNPKITASVAVRQLQGEREVPGVHMWLANLSDPKNSVRKLISKAKKEIADA